MRTDFHQSRRPGLCPALAGWQLAVKLGRTAAPGPETDCSLFSTCNKAKRVRKIQIVIVLPVYILLWFFYKQKSMIGIKIFIFKLVLTSNEILQSPKKFIRYWFMFIPFYISLYRQQMYEICFLFCLYYTLNLDRSLPPEFTNVKQLPNTLYFFSKGSFHLTK